MIVNEISFYLKDQEGDGIKLSISTSMPDDENIGGLTLRCAVDDLCGCKPAKFAAFITIEEREDMSNQLRLMADFIYGNP